MSLTEEEILSAAMSLPPEAKARVAEKLVNSVDADEQAEIDALLVVEVRRRLRDLEEGRAHTIPAEDVFKSIEARRRP
jgi:putative addiction module component (TIGR02574 family)